MSERTNMQLHTVVTAKDKEGELQVEFLKSIDLEGIYNTLSDDWIAIKLEETIEKVKADFEIAVKESAFKKSENKLRQAKLEELSNVKIDIEDKPKRRGRPAGSTTNKEETDTKTPSRGSSTKGKAAAKAREGAEGEEK